VGVRLARTSRAELAWARACPNASLAARPRQPALATSPAVMPEIAGGSHRARPASCARGSCRAGYARRYGTSRLRPGNCRTISVGATSKVYGTSTNSRTPSKVTRTRSWSLACERSVAAHEVGGLCNGRVLP
jgi:hypothetical protein